MRTLAIGDIHGCHTSLTNLLRIVQPRADDQMNISWRATYIDRGPASRLVMDLLINSSKVCSTIFLRGNHEVMILEAREDPLKANLWRSYGGDEMLASYSVGYGDDWLSGIPDDHWNFLEHTRPYFETDRAIFVHACLDPELDMEEQPAWLLYWEQFGPDTAAQVWKENHLRSYASTLR